ncbi:zinc ribbon domain-containing protein [bacterium]|nr:zinc ribbon domain-containing protein [bacterium]
MNCPRCGAVQDDDARFCKACGVAMAAPVPPDTPASPPPAPAAAGPPVAPSPRGGVPGWLIGCLVALIVVLVIASLVTGVLVYRNMAKAHELASDTQVAEETGTSTTTETEQTPEATDETETESPDATATETPSADTSGEDDTAAREAEAKAGARAVLDQYIAAERARNSPKMATYLTGQAAREFDATQTAHDTEIKSVDVVSTQVEDAEVVVFQVVMGASDLESGESYKMNITYRVIKTDAGWKISSIVYRQ